MPTTIPARRQHRKSLILRAFFLLLSLEGFAAFYALLQIPSDPRNAWLFRYSINRVIMLGGALVFALTCSGLFLKFWRDSDWRNRWVGWLDRFFSAVPRWKVMLMIAAPGASVAFGLFLLLVFSPLLIIFPVELIVRLLPILLLLALFTLQLLVSIALFDSHPFQKFIGSHKSRSTLLRTTTLLFILSFAVRLLFALPVALSDVQPRFDESAYMTRAMAFETAFRELASGNIASTENLFEAYGEGRWPPLHPMLLGAGLFLFGGNLAAARLVLVLFSALTTPLVYFLTRKIAPEKAALAAALVHVFYPGFIGFSHLLWSETTHNLFLLLGILSTVLLVDTNDFASKIAYALLAGLALSFSALARASALLYLLLVPLWFLFTARNRAERFILPAVFGAVSLVALLPWLYILQTQEGQFMPLATTGSYNLYLGNNAFESEDSRPTPLGYEGDTNQARQAINEYVNTHDVHPEAAARRLALEEIRANPSGFIQRSLARLGGFLGSSFFEIRHFAYAAYPPVGPALVIGLWLLFIIAFILLLAFAIIGLSGASALKYKYLILAFALTGMILPALTIANSRLYLPVLAALTPAAGAGVAALGRLNRRQAIFTAVATLAIAAAAVASIPRTVNISLRPSLYHYDLIQTLKRFMQVDPIYSDGFLVRFESTDADTLVLTILNDGLVFGENDSRTMEWQVAGGIEERSLTIYGREPAVPLEIEVRSESLDEKIIIRPVQPPAWWQWQGTALSNFQYLWAGGF